MPTPVTDPNEIAAYNSAGAAPASGPTPVTDPKEIAAYHAATPAPKSIYDKYDESRGDTGGPDLVTRFAAKFNKPVLDVAAPVIDALALPINKALGTNVYPGQYLRQTYAPDYGPAKDDTSDLVDAAGNMVGNTAMLMTGPTALATKVTAPAIDAAPTIANAIRAAISRAGASAAAAPVSTAATEGLAAAESGAAGEAARKAAERSDASPGIQNLAETAGQALGPTALMASPGALAARFTPDIIKRAVPAISRAASTAAEAIPEQVRPSWLEGLAQSGMLKQQADAKAAVADKLSAALSTPEAQAGMSDAERLQSNIPGFNPGVARTTGDAELKNTQQSLDTAATGEDLRARQDAYDKSQGAIRQKLESIIPQAQKPAPSSDFVGPMPATTTPQDTVAKSVASRIGEDTSKIANQTAATKGQIQSVSDSLPQTDRIAQGTALRESRDAAQRAMNAKTDELRGQIAEPDKVVVPPTEDTPAQTVNDLLNRRAAINQEMRDYTNATARTVDDVKQMRALQSERDQIDATIEQNADSLGGLRAYTQQYKTENVPQFRQGASAEVGQRDSLGYGGNRVDPEKVAGKFFNPNEESAAAQFDKAMGQDPGARQQLVDHALDDIRQKGTDPTTGLIKEGFIDKWLQRNSRVLNAMPQTGPEIRAAVTSKDPDALYDRLGQLAQRQRAVDDTKAAKALGQTPEKMITGALNDWQVMRGLKRSVGSDVNAQNALRRAVFEEVQRSAPDVMTDPEGFLGWMKGHDRALSQILTPEHKAALTDIAQAAKMQNAVPRPTGTVAVPKSILGTIQDSLGITVGSAASTARGVAQGRTSLPIEAAAQGVKFFNRQAAKASNAAWNEALSNPEAAKIVQNAVKGGTKVQSTKLRAYLVTAGLMPKNDEQSK